MTTQPQERDIDDLLKHLRERSAVLSWDGVMSYTAGLLHDAADEITRLRAQPSPREVAPEDELAARDAGVKAAADWLMSDDSAYGQSPEDAKRVAFGMLGVASAAYKAALSPAQKGEPG